MKAVKPYIYANQLNFKDKPFEAWKALGGATVDGWYPRWLHKLMFSFDMPTLWYGEARLVFVQPVSLYFDTFFTAPFHEMIPLIWDCWPMYYDKMEAWLKKHKVKTAFFTSKQEMAEMQRRCPNVKMVWCPEAVDVELYTEGKELTERSIDLLEFGRGLDLNVNDHKLTANFSKIKHVKTLVDGKFVFTEEGLYGAMSDAKVTICLPRSITHPEMADGVETLTQRYWEAMLSRMVIVGHCPKELEELIGYNPVIEVRGESAEVRDQIFDIIDHIADYQELVDRNREVALKMGDWKVRIKKIIECLDSVGYKTLSHSNY